MIIERGTRNLRAYVPDLPGCVAAGRARAEALRRMRTATRWHLEALRASGARVPKPTTAAAVVRVAKKNFTGERFSS